jgi:phosphopantothenoylcysteine decarboxylase / phosphopantothenate---cysteine ligase
MAHMLSNASITLLVSGSIAAYKSAELTRELQRQGSDVRIAMSKSAQEFITPLTLQTLSGNPVYTEMFDVYSEHEIGHISLADKADLILCAPATADCIAKAAHGIADDLISTVLLASRCPVVFVPAMNVNMWRNPVTVENVNKLKKAGYHVLEPDEGLLACGWTGPGRFPEIERIIDAAQYALYTKELKGTKVIVTAGPTKESVDPVRYVSNRSTGKMGYALARVSHWLGGDVTLISGPSDIPTPAGIRTIRVTTAEEMREAVFSVMKEPLKPGITLQAVYMAAAVSDHRPAIVSKEKLKMNKTQGYDLSFVPSIDILHELGSNRKEIEENSDARLLLVGFAAETGDEESMIQSGRGKRESKNVDMIVGNLAEESFGNDNARVWLIGKNGREEEVALADKHRVAERIIRASIKL